MHSSSDACEGSLRPLRAARPAATSLVELVLASASGLADSPGVTTVYLGVTGAVEQQRRADALLVLINSSITSFEQAARRD